ncbi:MAG: ribonuclease HIII [Anaplasmataceae bacterium]|nr:ribonuclease HIII [Anaplasmataceae bacterium]
MNKPSCFVATVDLALVEKLRRDLEDQGFVFTTPAYTLFSAQKKGISCTLYSSGKLTVQGKGMGEFIEFYLEPEILGRLSYTHGKEELLDTLDFTTRIGVDEAGKGDFFGPLCIASLKADEQEIRQLVELGVKDSKKLGDPAILKMAIRLKERFAHAIIIIYPKRYNELYQTFHNLNRLLAWGHATAIEELHKSTGCSHALIDKFGSSHLVENALKRKQLNIHLVQRTHAEEDPVVAAASILARAGFLHGMDQLSKEVGVELPKGASSKVIDTGKLILRKMGVEGLEKISKKHFKTFEEIMNQFEL